MIDEGENKLGFSKFLNGKIWILNYPTNLLVIDVI